MSTAPLKLMSVVLLVLGCHAPGAFAQPAPLAQPAPSARLAPSAAERLHADALASFRQARFPEAYGRFIKLADAGHAPGPRSGPAAPLSAAKHPSAAAARTSLR